MILMIRMNDGNVASVKNVTASSFPFRFSVILLGLLIACGGSSKQSERAGEPRIGDDLDEGSGGLLAGRSQTHRAQAPMLDDSPNDEGESNRSGVDIRGLKGTLDPYDIQRGIEPHQGALSACYNEKVGRRRYLGGDIVLQFTIARSGEVKRVSIKKSDLGAWDVERCMLEVSRTMRFTRPQGGEADFTLPLEFSPTRSVVWLDDETANAQVSEQKAMLRECAKKARRPKHVIVTLYVGARGAVTSVGFASSAKRPIGDQWADCAQAVIRSWILTDPLGRVAKLSFRYN